MSREQDKSMEWIKKGINEAGDVLGNLKVASTQLTNWMGSNSVREGAGNIPKWPHS